MSTASIVFTGSKSLAPDRASQCAYGRPGTPAAVAINATGSSGLQLHYVENCSISDTQMVATVVPDGKGGTSVQMQPQTTTYNGKAEGDCGNVAHGPPGLKTSCKLIGKPQVDDFTGWREVWNHLNVRSTGHERSRESRTRASRLHGRCDGGSRRKCFRRYSRGAIENGSSLTSLEPKG